MLFHHFLCFPHKTKHSNFHFLHKKFILCVFCSNSAMDSSLSIDYNKRTLDPMNLFQSDGLESQKPFREIIRLFLENFAEIQHYTVNGMPVWRSLILTESDSELALYTVEETVECTSFGGSFCDYCRIAGWGHHYVCKRKYHFVVSQLREEVLEADFDRIQSHYLYGLIHCNGLGHLVCVNGSGDQDNLFTATDAMDFWNNLCTVLKARKISMRDELCTGSVELRLIYGVAFRQSLFGRWGYKVCGEGLGITEEKYDWAVRFLGSLSLDRIVGDFRKRRNGNRIRQVVSMYRELSENPLVTLRDLMQFMLVYESKDRVVHNYNSCRAVPHSRERPLGFQTFVDSMARSDCRWSARRLEDVLTAIVDALKEHKEFCLGGMGRNDLREETRKSIGDTGLIDFVLKSIRCFQVDNLIIRRVVHSASRRTEFTIREITKESGLLGGPVLNYNCKWSQDKLENAVEVVMSILIENRGNNVMPQLELRDKASESINDAGLLDFVLKSIDHSRVGNRIVYRTKNPITKRVEFAVAENVEASQGPDNLFGVNLNQDVVFIYENVLLMYSESSLVTMASRVILECKQLLKEWPNEKEVVNDLMTVTCQVLPSFDELETELTRRLTPGVTLVVPSWYTISDLKLEVQHALRDTYCIMDEFVVTQIGGLRAMDNEMVLSDVVEPGGHLWVRGTGLNLVTKLRHEDGAQN